MKRFMILVNLFFATPQILRLSLLVQLLDFVVVFARRRIIAKPFSTLQVVFWANMKGRLASTLLK